MANELEIKPRAWLFFGCLAGLLIAPLLMTYLPNPFAGLGPEERPSRFIIFLWAASVVIIIVASYRLLTWTTYRANAHGLEARSLLGRTQLPWQDLISSELKAPVGMPPSYELRFKRRRVRLIAAHHDPRTIDALREIAPAR